MFSTAMAETGSQWWASASISHRTSSRSSVPSVSSMVWQSSRDVDAERPLLVGRMWSPPSRSRRRCFWAGPGAAWRSGCPSSPTATRKRRRLLPATVPAEGLPRSRRTGRILAVAVVATSASAMAVRMPADGVGDRVGSKIDDGSATGRGSVRRVMTSALLDLAVATVHAAAELLLAGRARALATVETSSTPAPTHGDELDRASEDLIRDRAVGPACTTASSARRAAPRRERAASDGWSTWLDGQSGHQLPLRPPGVERSRSPPRTSTAWSSASSSTWPSNETFTATRGGGAHWNGCGASIAFGGDRPPATTLWRHRLRLRPGRRWARQAEVPSPLVLPKVRDVRRGWGGGHRPGARWPVAGSTPTGKRRLDLRGPGLGVSDRHGGGGARVRSCRCGWVLVSWPATPGGLRRSSVPFWSVFRRRPGPDRHVIATSR